MVRKRAAQPLANTKRKLIAMLNPKSPVSEQYRTIRTNIEFSAIDGDVQTIMVTSTGPGEGKSTTAANLAVVFAQQGKKVLLVDADMRKPTVHYTFGLNNIAGLTNVLTGKMDVNEATKVAKLEHLYVLTCGPIPPNPAELLSSKAMKHFLNDVKDCYDVVVFDTPPVLAVTDAQVLSNQCDGTILVISSGKTEIENAQKTKDLLQAAKGKLLGVVLNHKKMENNDYYYYYGSK